MTDDAFDDDEAITWPDLPGIRCPECLDEREASTGRALVEVVSEHGTYSFIEGVCPTCDGQLVVNRAQYALWKDRIMR